MSPNEPVWYDTHKSYEAPMTPDTAPTPQEPSSISGGGDRELLERAAKAAGIEIGDYLDPIDRKYSDALGIWLQAGYGEHGRWWNPLNDDGDALRLAVKLNITVFIYDDESSTALNGVVAKNWGSKEANTRRAIVRAAASITPTGEAAP